VPKVKLYKGRAPLQQGMVKLFGDPKAKDEIPVWLFLVDPGHLRVMSDKDLRSMLDVQGFHGLDAITLDTREERERLAGLRLRLFQTAMKPQGEQWRLAIPSEAFETCEEYLDRTSIWIQQTANTLDVYTWSYVQKVTSRAPRQLLDNDG
jgi:hypothetical protein